MPDYMIICPPTRVLRVSLVTLYSLLLASGCASNVGKSYKAAPVGSSVELLPYSGTTAVYGSLNPDDDGVRLAQEGWRCVLVRCLSATIFKLENQ